MKKSFIFFLVGLLNFAFTFAQDADKNAIKKVCLAETQAYVDFDCNSWASCHVQSADEQLVWNNPDGSFGYESGWDKISKNMKEWFQTAKKENLKLSSDNFAYVIHGDMAFASFNRSSQNAEGKTTKMREYRTLLKKNGQWKILAIQAYADHPSGK